MSKFLKSSRFSNANAALKLRRDDESRKRDAYLSKDWRRSKPSSSPRSWFSFCSLCPSSSSSSRTSFFFALRKRFQTAVVSHWMPPHVSNNKSFRLASSCALYIIRLILTRALRSTVVVAVIVVVMPTLYFHAPRGGVVVQLFVWRSSLSPEWKAGGLFCRFFVKP